MEKGVLVRKEVIECRSKWQLDSLCKTRAICRSIYVYMYICNVSVLCNVCVCTCMHIHFSHLIIFL